MKDLKRHKKIMLIISIGLLLIIVGSGFLAKTILTNQDKYKKVKSEQTEKIEKVILKENLTYEINTDIKILFLISENNKVKILNKEEMIDTSTLGEQEITISYEANGKIKKHRQKIKIIDTIAPMIEYKKEIEATVGEKIDLLKDVKVRDNSNENINVHIEGTYDINKEGVYSLKYIAVDSSNNKKEEAFTLTVKKKKVPIDPEITDQFITTKGFQGYTKNGLTYIDGILIANKTYSLPSSYNPGLTNETSGAFNQMKIDAKSMGLNLEIISGFRSYTSQSTIYNNYVSKDGREKADTYSARAGHSEHQTGLAIDINSLYTSFENTEEGKWLKENSYKYGFILRYPKGKEEITGYMYEPWHYRYVGTKLATKLYNNGSWLTIEEYFGITSQY